MSRIIREDEWLAELEKLSRRNDKGMTGREWATAMGVEYKRALTKIKEAHALGWVRLGKRTVARIDGNPTTVTVYSIQPPKSPRRS